MQEAARGNLGGLFVWPVRLARKPRSSPVGSGTARAARMIGKATTALDENR